MVISRAANRWYREYSLFGFFRLFVFIIDRTDESIQGLDNDIRIHFHHLRKEMSFVLSLHDIIALLPTVPGTAFDTMVLGCVVYNITVTSQWTPWLLKSQQFVHARIKAPRHRPLWGGSTGGFPLQMASNAENVSIWWRHHDEGSQLPWPGMLEKLTELLELFRGAFHDSSAALTQSRLTPKNGY